MFSKNQKQYISNAIEKLLLELNHPEMPSERPVFTLNVKGKEEWSYAVIEPNWYFENKKPGVNPWNELFDDSSKISHDVELSGSQVDIPTIPSQVSQNIENHKTFLYDVKFKVCGDEIPIVRHQCFDGNNPDIEESLKGPQI